MKRRTDIFTRLLWLLSLLMVACTGHDAIVDDLSRQDASVTVRMQVSDMKETASRAAEEDNITSIVALVFRDKKLQSVTKYPKANSALHPISPIAGTITIDKPENEDVIHFLANLPANYSEGVTYVEYLQQQNNQSQETVLCNLTSSDYSKLSYWGMATYNSNDAVMDVLLYRNKAMIEIKPDEGCTFQENELFIAGLDNPNTLGKLVPYNNGFNFNLNNNDYHTIPDKPYPLDKTDELTNYGAGYDNAYYVFEHANPKDANGLYVICKIGHDYYKVALQDDAGNHYPIIRNHKYTILVKDLDAGSDSYADALNADPVNLKVVETGMSVTPAVATINMDANPAVTSTTLTLTKPTDMQNVKVSITDGNGANANSWFNIRIDNNDLWYDQNNNIFGDIQNGNTNVQVALTVKDNTIPSGTYTVRFTDSNNQSTYVDATITIQNTPKLIYEYTNKTLYLLDSTGASNPTSLDVKVTVPNGSTLNSLTIEALGFIIKNGERTLVDGGTYTDNTERVSNSSVTYTFTPKVGATDYTITFSSTDDDLKADEEIEVTVSSDRAPNEDVIWEATPVEIGWNDEKGDNRFLLTDNRIMNNPSICIVIDVPGTEHGQFQLQGFIPGYFSISNLTKGETDKHVIINTKQNNTEPDGTLILEGAGVTLKKIYIPSTSE